MKKILITGKGSYLGASLRDYLSALPGYQVDELSLRGFWQNADFAGYDAIYHTAAMVHQSQSKDDPRELEHYRQINRDLAVQVAEKAKESGVPQFIFLSTMAVYGLTAAFGSTVTITAATPVHPTDNYGLSKLEAEQALLALETDRFRVAILRPPMIYGKGCKGNFRSLVSIAEKLPCFPKVSNQRSMLYVGNLNRLVQLLLDSGERGVFCPQNQDFVSTSEMIRAIAAAKGRPLPLIPGFQWAFWLLRHFTGAVDKAFGSLCYDKALSSYRVDYCPFSYSESILLSIDES